jgi:hypothetical protein
LARVSAARTLGEIRPITSTATNRVVKRIMGDDFAAAEHGGEGASDWVVRKPV